MNFPRKILAQGAGREFCGYIITLALGPDIYEIHTSRAGQYFMLCLPDDPANPLGFTRGKSLGGCTD